MGGEGSGRGSGRRKPPTPEELRQWNKCAFWNPWPHQQRVLDLIHRGKKVILAQGANRIGKTVLGANVTASAIYGVEMWAKPEPIVSIWGDKPIKVRILAQDWEHHAKEVIVPALYEWFPRDMFETRKNNMGVEAYFTTPNGSTIELLTNTQETKYMEGWKGDFVWADEPLSREKFTVLRRGLVDNSGVFLMTMTAVGQEVWIMDDVALSTEPHIGTVMEVPMRANPLLKQSDIDNFEKDTPINEREARIKGGWLQLVGKIWKAYSEKNAVDPFNIPPDWPVVAMIDLHLNVPQAISFFTWDQHDRMFQCGEIWENISPENIGNEIVRRKNKNGWRLQNAFIDPLSKGDSAYVKNRFGTVEDSYTIIQKKLQPYGIRLHTASKDKASGIRNVDNKFKGINGPPSLFIFNDCKQTLWEIQRWVYDKEGKPKDENDHFCENLYRSTLTGTKYTRPEIFTEPLNYQSSTGVV